ncbi:hypothetical protein JM946_20515 [Steroidobacter sp. S1-65]|uniref:Transposase n=1 Tax=Steroidobacter gossypii TaxID=2805490 RepID=A0ABS1X1N2_9GAMM|nr:hypothetical protein [Steroidobacter gossypii]MBM0107126.1 hypothetical protein [Steroidobacter gossypii]
MDVSKVASYVGRVLQKHDRALSDIAVHQTAFLELAAFVASYEHYRINGANVRLVHPAGDVLTVKTSTRGHPSKFSRAEVVSKTAEFEIHMNLPVRGAHSGGVFCVDVGVVASGSIPIKPKVIRGKEVWRACENRDLISFAEVKKLVVYPMLLAHFVGIVHELLPRFLVGRRPRGFKAAAHFDPLLLTLGSFSGTSQEVMKSFAKRRFALTVVPAFDVRLGRLRAGRNKKSPFDVRGDLSIPRAGRRAGAK